MKITETIDSKEGLIDSSKGSNTPSVADMRKSQDKGLTGIGTADKSFNESMGDFNQGTGVPVKEKE